MTNGSLNRCRPFILLALVAGIVAGCAGDYVFVEPAGNPTPSADGTLEEVVVTGSRAGSNRTMRSREARSAEAPACITLGGCIEDVAFAGDEEIWVIQKADNEVLAASGDEPGSGAMLTMLDSRKVPLPLQHTDVKAVINGYIGSVNVRQQFENPFASKIEAVYLFPLPEKAAISEFLMIIGERRIRGILREKEEARAIYEKARSQGYRASLLVQHRPNIFEQKVANIEPGTSIEVDIKYFHTLPYNDGWYSFVLPTVIGPRYNPPASGDPIAAIPRTQADSGSTAVRYLRPEERSAHDISIDVQIDAGVNIEELRSGHKIVASQPDAQSASVQLAHQSTIPNRDFVLDFKVAGGTLKSDLLTYFDNDLQQGYFTLMLHPPATTEVLPRRNMEMVFVIDASGSMKGRPMEQARNAVTAALDHLQAGDTFQIIRFSDNASQFGRVPVPATKANIASARRYLRRLNGGGGTQMVEGVRAALDFPHDPSRLRFVSFLTDGYIGNEVEILREVSMRIGSSRIFSFGVGSSVNRYLMDRMAKVGRGAVAYLGPEDSGYDVMQDFFDRVSHPALTDVRIDWNGMVVSDLYPAELPDVFVGRPILVTGKYQGVATDIVVHGQLGDVDRRIVVRSDGEPSAGPSLAKVWARLRIAELEDRKARLGDPDNELAIEIGSTALAHQLMSAYTSFVAVDTSERTEGTYGTTVHQAVPVPDGVRYDTTVEQN